MGVIRGLRGWPNPRLLLHVGIHRQFVNQVQVSYIRCRTRTITVYWNITLTGVSHISFRCLTYSYPQIVGIISGVFIGIVDTILLYITICRTFHHTREARRVGIKVPVSTALLQNGEFRVILFGMLWANIIDRWHILYVRLIYICWTRIPVDLVFSKELFWLSALQRCSSVPPSLMSC